MNKPLTVLVADDDRGVLTVINEALSRAGHRVRGTESASVLWNWIKEGEGDVVITDVIMPDIDGLELLPRIRKERPELPVIVMSARKTLQTAVSAADRGAYEYLPKPFDINELANLVERSQEKSKTAPSVSPPDGSEGPLVGRSTAMQSVYRTMAKIMMTDLTVLITGESGTGKELVAQALHDLGPRRAGPFIPVNMAAMPKELIESELFGHERGAFTGAVSRRPGRFEQAQGGTLFLDEIGDMPSTAQIHLLRVLQQQEFRSVGGHQAIRADVRIIAATNHPVARLIDEGKFREDLYYRLNVVPIAVPPLRERIEDLPDLVEHFLARVTSGGEVRSLSENALGVLEDYSWPGNVRELENLLKRVVALYPDDVITSEILKRELSVGGRSAGQEVRDDGLAAAVETHIRRYFAAHTDDLPPSGLYQRVLREVERPLLRLTLRATEGNQLRAAGVLGLNRNTLRKKLNQLGITPRKNTKNPA